MKSLALCIMIIILLIPISLSDISYSTKFASRQQEVKSIIREYTKIVPDNIAENIAQCESNFGLYLTNFEGSGAYGLFQFKPMTWNAYCEGDINSFIDQTICFDKLYLKHKSWWECR